MVRNAAIDLRYGGILAAERLRDRVHSNTDYGALRAMRFGPIRDDDVLVDIGCGAGRVLNHWLSLGLDVPMVGIELDPETAERCRRRLRRHPNVHIRCGDAIDVLPEDGTIFYMFNPVWRAEGQRLEAALGTLAGTGRLRRIVYYNPRFVDLFEAHDRWDIEYDERPGNRTIAPFQPVAYITPAAPARR